MAKFWKSILQKSYNGTLLNEFSTIQSAADLTGVKRSDIYNCCNANRDSDEMHYEMAGGYIWQYGYEV